MAKRNINTSNPPQLPAEGFVRKPQLLAVLGIGQTTLRENIVAGIFPPGVLLSPRLRVWEVSEVRATIEKIKRGEISLTKYKNKAKPTKVNVSLDFQDESAHHAFIENVKASGLTADQYLADLVHKGLPDNNTPNQATAN